MNAESHSQKSAPRVTGKLVSCVLPDDGSDKDLLNALYREKQITTAESVPILGMDVLADARVKPGTLPDAYLARLVRIVVPEREADALFEYVYERAHIGRPGCGVIFQSALVSSTPYRLPEGVEEEA